MDLFQAISRSTDLYSGRPLVFLIQALESESLLLNRLDVEPIFKDPIYGVVIPWKRIKPASSSSMRSSGQSLLISLERYPVQCIVTRLAQLIPEQRSDMDNQERFRMFQSTLDKFISEFVESSRLANSPNSVNPRWPTIHLVVFHRMDPRVFVSPMATYPLPSKALEGSIDITYTFVNMSASDPEISSALKQPLQRGCAILRDWYYYLDSNRDIGNYSRILQRHLEQARSLGKSQEGLLETYNSYFQVDSLVTRQTDKVLDELKTDKEDSRTTTDGLPDDIRIDTLRRIEKDNWFLVEHELLKLAYTELSIQNSSKNPVYIQVEITQTGVKSSTQSELGQAANAMLSISLASIYDETLSVEDVDSKFKQRAGMPASFVWNSACDFAFPVKESLDLTTSAQVEARLIRHVSYPVGLPQFAVYPPYWSAVSNHVHPSIAFLLMRTDMRSFAPDVLGWHFRLTRTEPMGPVTVDLVFKRNIAKSSMQLLYRRSTAPDQVTKFNAAADTSTGVAKSLISQVDSVLAETVLDLNNPSKCVCEFACAYERVSAENIQYTQFYYDRCMNMAEAVTHPDTLREPRAVQRRILHIRSWFDKFDQILDQPDFGFEESVKSQFQNCAGLVIHDGVMFLVLHQPMKVWTGSEIGLRTQVTRLLTVPICGTSWLIIDPPHQTKDSQIQIYNYYPVPPGLYNAMQSVFVRAEFLEDIVHIISRASRASGSIFHFACKTHADPSVTPALLASHLVLSQGWFSKGATFRVASSMNQEVSNQLHSYKDCVFYDLQYSTAEISQAVVGVAASTKSTGNIVGTFNRIQNAAVLSANYTGKDLLGDISRILSRAEEFLSDKRSIDDLGQAFGSLVPTESTLCLNRDILYVARSLSAQRGLQWDNIKDISDRDFVALSRLQKLGTFIDLLRGSLPQAIRFDVPMQLTPEARVLMVAKYIKDMEPGNFSKRLMQTIFAQQGTQELLFYQQSTNAALITALEGLNKLGKLRDDVGSLMDLLKDVLKKNSDFDQTEKRKIVDALAEVKQMVQTISKPELTEFLEKSKAITEASLKSIIGPALTSMQAKLTETLTEGAKELSAGTKVVVEDSIQTMLQPALTNIQTGQYLEDTKNAVQTSINSAVQALQAKLDPSLQDTKDSTTKIASLLSEVRSLVSTLGPSVDMAIQQINDYKQWWFDTLRGSTFSNSNSVPDNSGYDAFEGYIKNTQVVGSVLELAGLKRSWQYISCQLVFFELVEWTLLPRLICQFMALSTLINKSVEFVYLTGKGVQTKRFSSLGIRGKVVDEQPAMYLVWKGQAGFQAHAQEGIPNATFALIVESLGEQAMQLRIAQDDISRQEATNEDDNLEPSSKRAKRARDDRAKSASSKANQEQSVAAANQSSSSSSAVASDIMETDEI